MIFARVLFLDFNKTMKNIEKITLKKSERTIMPSSKMTKFDDRTIILLKLKNHTTKWFNYRIFTVL